MRIDFVDDVRGIAVIVVSRNNRERSVAGAEDDDADHQGGGEAEGKGFGLYEGHFSRLLLEAGIDPGVTGAR